ncbi:MAG: shikimate dehydrogenase [Chloroflexi bacterium]|nr:shikimate dehydrogenase [Chloroflexota bacterium]
MMRHCGVIGRTLKHSISAVFQQAAFDACHLDVLYHAWELEPDAVAPHVAQLRRDGFLGTNVTIPYKLSVLSYVDEQDPLVAQVGAANTIVSHEGRLAAFNTDVGGFAKALREDLGTVAQEQRVLLLGAGGAARAVAVALLRDGAHSIIICARGAARAHELATTLDDARVQTAEWRERDLHELVRGATLIVNATPLGMLGELQEATPLPDLELQPQAFVFDLVANPLETRLMREAASVGARVVGGLPMLIYQGAESFELWTGIPAPLTVMRAAAEEHMRARDHWISEPANHRR